MGKYMEPPWIVENATYASNKQISIGRSDVDASRSVLSVAKPPGL
jgi:hypothetical protein